MAQLNWCTPRRGPGTTAATTEAGRMAGTTAPRIAATTTHGVAAGAIVAGAGAIAALAYLGSRFVTRVEVVGMSMAPALLPGDRLLVLRWPRLVAPWPFAGEVVALRDPRRPARVLVKRVGTVDRHAATVEVLGDDASASTDSRSFGPVPRSLVLGRAVYRYAPPGRVGRGPWPLGLRST